MVFHAGHSRQVTTTIEEACGAYGEGRVLTNVNPAEWIYLAMNGNNANSGLTPALAKRTLPAARAATTALRPMVHIIRNGFVGDLIFDWPAVNGDLKLAEFVPNQGIQVELGEYATVTLNTVFHCEMFQTASLNGIKLIGGNRDSAFTWLVIVRGSNIIRFCTLINNTVPRSVPITEQTHTVLSSFFQTFVTCTIDGVAFYGHTSIGQISNTGSFSFTRCLFVLWENGLIDFTIGLTTGVYHKSVWFDQTPRDEAYTITFSRCAILNYDNYSVLRFLDSTVNHATIGPTYVIQGSVNAASQYLVKARTGLFICKLNFILNYVQNNAANQVLIVSQAGATIDPTITIVATNPLNVPALLYVNIDGAVNFSPDGVRLRYPGKLSPSGSGRYVVPSPLINAFAGTVDAAPWTESTVFGPHSWLYRVPIDFVPQTQNRERLLKRAVEKETALGDSVRAYASAARRWSFAWSDYGNNRDRINLELLLQDNGPVLYFPRTDDDNSTLFDDSIVGAFDSVNMRFAPTVGEPMIPHNWQALLVYIYDGTILYHYYIIDNDDIYFYVKDIFEQGVPASGNYTFYVRDVLVRISIQPIIASQQNYTGATRGGEIRERPPGVTEAFEPNNFNLVITSLSSMDYDE